MSLRANDPQDSQASELQNQLDDALKEVDQLKDERDHTAVANSEFYRQATDEISQLREQLEDQARLAGEWYDRAKSAITELTRLQSQPPMAIDPKALTILRSALKLRANAGGAIKKEIEKVLELLHQPHP